MSHVLVIGASGYIGGGVARAFRRAGHHVYGTLRSGPESKAHQQLLQDEITPVVGDTSQPHQLRSYVEKCSVIVDAVGYAPESPHSLKFFEYVVGLKKAEVNNFKTTYIFTSGIMIYATGDRVDFPIDESLNPTPRDPIEMIPKKAIESAILSNTSLYPIVVRPGFVYGGHGGVIASLFFDVLPDQPTIDAWGGLDKRWSWVHVDDLGDAYVRIAHRAPSVSNQVFNVASPGDNPTFLELKYECARAAGWRGTKKDVRSLPVPEKENRVQNWEWNVVINPRKAMDVLGWQPKHVGFLNEVDVYYRSWRAAATGKSVVSKL